MVIEEINTDNLASLTELMLELWPDSNFDEEIQNARNILAKSDETCFLVKKDDTYVAFVQLALRYDYVEGTVTSPVGYIEGIYVKAPFRKLGIGRRLSELGEKWAKENGCQQFASDAESNNLPSIDFHRKLGFKETNRLVCFVKNLVD